MALMIRSAGLESDGTPSVQLLGSKIDISRAAKCFGDEVILVPVETLRAWFNQATNAPGGLASSIGQYLPSTDVETANAE